MLALIDLLALLKIVGALLVSLFALWAIVTVLHDDRIQDPYSSIVVFVIMGLLAYFAKHFYL